MSRYATDGFIMKSELLNEWIYIAKPEYIHELCEELGSISSVIENMVFSENKNSNVCFALDIWKSTKKIKFESIKQAVDFLKQEGKFWFLNPIACFRRSKLIEKQLRKLPDLRLHFPFEKTLPEIQCFSLIDQNTMIISGPRWKPIPLGHYHFVEDKTNPPNRAYLKLWEALTFLQEYPKPGELTLDLGSSPGGWTYVLQSLGAKVISVDKAPLDPKIANLPNVTFLKQSAFALEPNQLDSIDWFCSDMICYPEKLYEFILKWIGSGKVKRMICSVKLQGKTDLNIIRKFQSIPHGRIIHLYNNKHEATFFYKWS